jgi:hypothetical protein
MMATDVQGFCASGPKKYNDIKRVIMRRVVLNENGLRLLVGNSYILGA